MPNYSNIKSVGFGVQHSNDHFKEIHFERRPLDDNSILIDILYAGICHSDLHTIREHWGRQEFPIIPGHEIVGVVKEKGKNVDKFQIGDYAGIGCMIDSCEKCDSCKNDREQDCSKTVLTYASKDWKHNDITTLGGYSINYVINQDFAIKVPKNCELQKVPSLLCAGITTFSPIRQVNVSEGMVCGVLGLGGLGTMAAKYLKDVGATVIAFDKINKQEYADKLDIKFIKVGDEPIDKSFNKKFDFIISTIPYKYELTDYLPLMKYNSTFAIVGLPPYAECPDINIKDLILNYPGVKIMGSQIGGIKETQLCLDFSINNNIYPEVKEIEPKAEDIDKAYDELSTGNVEGRFVINMKHFNNTDNDSDNNSYSKREEIS